MLGKLIGLANAPDHVTRTMQHLDFLKYQMPRQQHKLKIRKLQPGEHPPWDLLLKFGSSKSHAQRLLAAGTCYVAILRDDVVGQYILQRGPEERARLSSFSLMQTAGDAGLGKAVIAGAVEKAKSWGATILEAGIGNSSLTELSLLQKCGFRILGVERDFFALADTHPVVENGILRRDLLLLQLAIAY